MAIIAVKTVFGASVPNGVNVAVKPTYVTAPETGVAPCFRMKVAVVMVKGFIA